MSVVKLHTLKQVVHSKYNFKTAKAQLFQLSREFALELAPVDQISAPSQSLLIDELEIDVIA